MVKLFLNYRFYHLLYRANASRREEEKKRKIRWWRTWRKGKLIFFSFFFCWENVLFTSYVIRWCRKTFKGNSQKQPLTDVLQNMYSLCWSLFLIKLQAWRSVFLLKKEIPTQVFACEYCDIFKNTYFDWSICIWLLLELL